MYVAYLTRPNHLRHLRQTHPLLHNTLIIFQQLLNRLFIFDTPEGSNPIRDPLTRGPEILLVNRRETQAEVLPPLRSLYFVGRTEHLPRRNEDEIRVCSPEKPEAAGETREIPGFLVGAVERVCLEVDLEPEEHAADRPVEGVHLRLLYYGPFVVCGGGGGGVQTVAAPGFDLVFARVEDFAHFSHATFVIPAEPFNPADPAVGFPARARGKPAFAALFVGREAIVVGTEEELGDHALHESGRLLGGCFSDAKDTFHKLRLGGDPAKSAARRDGFGESVKADDAAFGVDVDGAGHERVEEGVAAGFPG